MTRSGVGGSGGDNEVCNVGENVGDDTLSMIIRV